MSTPVPKLRTAFLSAVCALALCALALLVPAAARADVSFCEAGEGAGQCEEAMGVATDFETGRLYVADKGNDRVDVFAVEGGGVVFKFAFGWDVNASAPAEELQTCTAATGCQKGSSGSGAGQLSAPEWVAVDNSPLSLSRHDLYVTDASHRVQKFDPSGGFLLMFGKGVNSGSSGNTDVCTSAGAPSDVCGAGIAAFEAGAFDEIHGVAVVSPGTVYVADTEHEPESGCSAIGRYRKRVQHFDPEGGWVEQVVPTDVPCGAMYGFAADEAGDYYLFNEGPTHALRRYEPSGTEAVCEDAELYAGGLAVGPAGELFASQDEPFPTNMGVVTKYGPGCEGGALPIERRFAYGKFAYTFLHGLAVYHSEASGVEGDVFGTEYLSKGVVYLAIPPAGPLVAKTALSKAGSVNAHVRVEVNPEGKPAEYVFQWVDEADYQKNKGEGGDGFEGGGVSESSRVSLPVPAGREFRADPAEGLLGCEEASKAKVASGECLTPETTYDWRVLAEDGENHAGEGPMEGEPFTTGPYVEATEVFASAAGSEEVTLNAVVNPHGTPATGFFEYVTQAQYEASGFTDATQTPDIGAGQTEIGFGGGEVPVRRSVVLTGLPPGTAFRFRVAVTDPLIEEYLHGTPERVGSFTTFRAPGSGECPANEAFRTGFSALLPDCRAYEMVSPVDKEGGDIAVLLAVAGEPAVVSESALSGDRMTYGSYRALGGAASGPYTSQYLAVRRAGVGWVSEPISPPHGAPLQNPPGSLEYEFRGFSEDLCRGWLIPFNEPPAVAGAIPGYLNLYRWSNPECGEGEGLTDFSSAKPESFPPGPASALFVLELEGVSADGQVAVFAANDTLEGSGAPAQPAFCSAADNFNCRQELYVQQAGGSPQFVCVLPNGRASTKSCSAGVGGSSFPHPSRGTMTGALSADGSRVFWTDSNESGAIYLRENPLQKQSKFSAGRCSEPARACTIAVSAAAEAEVGGIAPHSNFKAAAADGSRAVFVTSTGSGSSEVSNLYEFQVEGEVTRKIAGEMAGGVLASRDARRVYFLSEEAIAAAGANSQGSEPVAGKPNLYLYEAGEGGGSYRFIATLAGGDELKQAYVDASGSQLAFTSSAHGVTPFDNTDVESPEACGESHPEGICDSEVYLFDATANGGDGQTVCVSCNPAGTRPAGVNLGNETFPRWVAAQVPPRQNTLYSSRVLSASGDRLFFEAIDALAPQDTNGRIDVYEWERAGTGSCSEAAGAFVAAADGCVSLISSGQGGQNVRLLDADAEGENVFFTTGQSLVAQDPGLVDVYDARVNGGLPGPAKPAARCEGESCQPAAPAPLDQTPASITFNGPGNLIPAPAVNKQKKHKTQKKSKRHKKHKARGKHKRHKTHGKHRRHHKRGHTARRARHHRGHSARRHHHHRSRRRR